MKKETWLLIAEEFAKATCTVLTADKLIKRWKNLQSALKEKLNWTKDTGGGEPKPLNIIDHTVQRILGEKNPIINRIPGALFSKDSTVFTPSNLSFPSTSAPQEEFRPNPSDCEIMMPSPAEPSPSPSTKRHFTFDPETYLNTSPAPKKVKAAVAKELTLTEKVQTAQLRLPCSQSLTQQIKVSSATVRILRIGDSVLNSV